MSVLDKHLRVTMPDGSRWDVPVRVIAESRAAHYADEFDNDVAQSLKEDTEPLFEDTPYEVMDWAANNMNWSDVKDQAKPAPPKPMPKVDWEEGWMNGDKEIV